MAPKNECHALFIGLSIFWNFWLLFQESVYERENEKGKKKSLNEAKVSANIA